MSQLATLAAHRHHGNTEAILRQLDELLDKYLKRESHTSTLH